MIMNCDLDKRIAVLLSGGVDSSVVVYELARQGLHPDCFYIKIGPEENEEWDCSSEEDLEMATAVAVEKVRAGYTPNPDVMCNRLIKFGAFNEKAGNDYDLIATGHYAQTEIIDGLKWLTTSPDPVKDQTDFLAQIHDWQLRKAIFPIGHYMKDEVRAIAEREHLINAKRKDSQGICFLGKINYNDYIRRYLGENPGNVVELETGRVIGQHKGLWFHTIGQRHGLGFGGGPWYAVKKDIGANILYVSKGYEPLTAYKKEFSIRGFNYLTCNPWKDSPVANITFKIRHTPEFHKATLERVDDNSYNVHSADLIQGVAPGQFCVVYDENHNKCIGSGEISPQIA